MDKKNMISVQPAPSYVFRDPFVIESLHCLSLSPDCSHECGEVFTGDAAGNIHIFNISTRRRIQSYHDIHSKTVLSIFLDDYTAFSQARDGFVQSWDIESGHVQATLCCGSMNFCRAYIGYVDGISATHPAIFCSGGDNTTAIELWDISCDKRVLNWTPNESSRIGMCMALDFVDELSDFYVAGAYENGEIMFWDIRNTSKPFITLEINKGVGSEPLLSLAFDRKKKTGICVGASEKLISFRYFLASGEAFLLNKRLVIMPSKGINDIRIREDSKIVASGGWDHRIRIYNWKNMNPLAILKGHRKGVNQVKFSQDDNSLFTVGSDSKLMMWNLY